MARRSRPVTFRDGVRAERVLAAGRRPVPRYRLETRNSHHPQTAAWASSNPFRHGAPWLFETVDEARTRASVCACTDARVVDVATDAVVAQWTRGDGSAELADVVPGSEAPCARRTKLAKNLVAGDVVARLPYGGGPEQLPLTVLGLHPARTPGYVVVEGKDARGARVLVPLGHGGNVVEVQ